MNLGQNKWTSVQRGRGKWYNQGIAEKGETKSLAEEPVFTKAWCAAEVDRATQRAVRPTRQQPLGPGDSQRPQIFETWKKLLAPTYEN